MFLVFFSFHNPVQNKTKECCSLAGMHAIQYPSVRKRKKDLRNLTPPRPKSKLSESNHTLTVAKSEQMPKDEPETNQHVVIIPHDLNPPVKTQCSVTPPAMRKPSPKIKPTNVECDHRLHIVQHGSEFLKEDSWSLGTCVGGLGPGTWRGSR